MGNLSACNRQQDSDGEGNDPDSEDSKYKPDEKYKTAPSLFRDSELEFLFNNSDETALLETMEYGDSELDVTSLRSKFLAAVKDENEYLVKSLLNEFSDTSYVLGSFFEKEIDIVEIGRDDDTYIEVEKDTERLEKYLKILLDGEIDTWRLETDIGYPILHECIRNGEGVDDEELRLIELLLKSGKINPNAIDVYGKTVLHLAEEEKLTSLLIRYGADVNRKDDQGKTPLITQSEIGYRPKVSVLPIILEVAGTLVDLDAMDCNGQTALMIATIDALPDVVEFLLNAGASVNLSDHLGFTALHHALYATKFLGTSLAYDQFPRNSEELKKRKEIFASFCHTKRYEVWNHERKKIVEMLLRRPDIDANAVSFEKFSPLDIAEGWIPEIPSSIKKALKEKGAVLNVFRQTESQSKNKFYLDVRCKTTLQRLVINARTATKEDSYFLKEGLLTLLEAFKEHLVAGKDQQGRTALHLVAISFYIISAQSRIITYRDYKDQEIDLANTIVERLISFGCCVNATDTYGRTPLHYADGILWKLLISKGADASIRDKDGNTAIDKTLRLYDVQYHDSQDARSCEELNHKRVLELLWKEGKYAYRHPLASQLAKEVRALMDAIAKDIERLDPRFEIRPEFVGSSNEGAKIDEPDEFDFCFVLTKISELCEVSRSPELPTGFVHLKRKPKQVGETSDFDSFFGKDGILNTEKLNWQFTTILRNALVNIECQKSFNWNLELQKSEIYVDSAKISRFKLNKRSYIMMIKPLNFTPVDYISIDVVPCIHVDGWWPDEAICNVNEDIKKFGCNLVFDSPQKLYRWVPYSESCARISFSKAESDMIKHSCDNGREAYMIGKTIVDEAHSDTNYSLKNSLLYCIEALTPTSEKASQLRLSLEELESKFHKMDRYMWLKILMKCRLEFVSQDFCPCYFLPNFSSAIGKRYVKEYSLEWLTRRSFQYLLLRNKACALYRFTSNDTSESCRQLPAPDPLWEQFDRNQFIDRLFKIAYETLITCD